MMSEDTARKEIEQYCAESWKLRVLFWLLRKLEPLTFPRRDLEGELIERLQLEDFQEQREHGE